MFVIVNGERHGLYIGGAKLKLKKKNKAGDMFCTGKAASSPRQVKECLLLATRLCLRHPAGGPISTNEDLRDNAMEVIHKNESGAKRSKNNSVTTVNNHILKTLVKILSVFFLMDSFGPISTAQMNRSTTPEDVQSMLKHNQKVIIHFCLTHDDPGYTNDYFPQGMCLLSFFVMS